MEPGPDRVSFTLTRLIVLWMIFSPLYAGLLYAAESSVSFRNTGGKNLCRFVVEVARTSLEQERGLMFRQNLDREAGMLFVYESDGARHFWMKNTPIPLDLVFIDSRLKVVDVYSNARPFDEHIISSTQKAQYVLEINGGAAASCGIKPGITARFQNIGK